MSFESAWKTAVAIEFIGEQLSENLDTAQVLFRVKDKKLFSKLLTEALIAAKDETTFGFRAQKQYFLDDKGVPTFAWMLMVWGDFDDAINIVAPILGKSPPVPVALKPPPSVAIVESKGGKVNFLRVKVVRPTDGEPFQQWTSPLPQRQRDRNNISRADRRPRTIHDMGKRQQVWVDNGLSEPTFDTVREGL